MIIKIYVNILQRKFTILFDEDKYSRKSAKEIIKLLELKLPGMVKKYGSVAVQVIFKDGKMESLQSADCEYLVYTTCCFLENHLSEEFMLKRSREWFKHENLTILQPWEVGGREGFQVKEDYLHISKKKGTL